MQIMLASWDFDAKQNTNALHMTFLCFFRLSHIIAFMTFPSISFFSQCVAFQFPFSLQTASL